MSDPQNLLYRMMGGVAGAMDQVDSNTLSRLPSGQYGYVPSRKHLDRMGQIIQPNLSSGYNFAVPRQQVILAQQEEDKMDVSKYLGKNKLQQQKPQPNSQLELLKMALEPINDQLEKICILLGMIYQKLDGVDAEQEGYVEPVSGMEVTQEVDDDMAPEEQIAVLERAMSNRPKAPGTEELGEIDNDPQIEM